MYLHKHGRGQLTERTSTTHTQASNLSADSHAMVDEELEIYMNVFGVQFVPLIM